VQPNRENRIVRSRIEEVDISASPDLLSLAEEVRRSQSPRLLKRGDEEIALLTPLEGQHALGRRKRVPRGQARDSILLTA
jgi:hypothetical protein